jgi:hypothetical protein
LAIEKVIGEARKRGFIKSASSDACIAEVIFYLFAADVRRWLGQERSPIADGLDHLGGLFTVVLAGLGGSTEMERARVPGVGFDAIA